MSLRRREVRDEIYQPEQQKEKHRPHQVKNTDRKAETCVLSCLCFIAEQSRQPGLGSLILNTTKGLSLGNISLQWTD